MIFCKPAVRCTLLTMYSVTNTAIFIFVNMNILRYIKHELRNMIAMLCYAMIDMHCVT